MSSFFQQRRVLILHLSFWCVYLSFFLYQLSSFRGKEFDWERVITAASLQITFAAIAAYLNFFFLLPRFLRHKNLLRYIAEFILPFALLMVVRISLDRYIVDGFSGREEWIYSTRFVVQVIMVNLFIVIFVAMLRFAQEWIDLEAKKKEVENERLIAELNFLKAQINPHFLFNTLNNLYYLAYSKSENTTEVIAKLSQMMRYMIYDSNHPKVLLKKEIEYMLNYISLERLRLNDQVPIQFNVSGSTENVWITPLIFITFLENAFKHGVSNNNPKSWVNISICLKDTTCVYTVENSKRNESKENVEKSGIGLRNVRRRLELSYPGAYSLEMNDTPEKYTVKLNLELA
ncbi:histidine kinase [Chryseolinea sp. T2]|uniref:sensor histidine kinase n=1 Tax=Chryseolinea sp. T2 TaxID=3129255 RepID=UPI0030773A3C